MSKFRPLRPLEESVAEEIRSMQPRFLVVDDSPAIAFYGGFHREVRLGPTHFDIVSLGKVISENQFPLEELAGHLEIPDGGYYQEMIRSTFGSEFVDVTPSGKQALHLMDERYYDVVFLGSSTSDLPSERLMNEVIDRHPNTKLILMPFMPHPYGIPIPDYMILALSQGKIAPYVRKPFEPEELPPLVFNFLRQRNVARTEAQEDIIHGIEDSFKPYFVRATGKILVPEERFIGKTVVKEYVDLHRAAVEYVILSELHDRGCAVLVERGLNGVDEFLERGFYVDEGGNRRYSSESRLSDTASRQRAAAYLKSVYRSLFEAADIRLLASGERAWLAEQIPSLRVPTARFHANLPVAILEDRVGPSFFSLLPEINTRIGQGDHVAAEFKGETILLRNEYLAFLQAFPISLPDFVIPNRINMQLAYNLNTVGELLQFFDGFFSEDRAGLRYSVPAVDMGMHMPDGYVQYFDRNWGDMIFNIGVLRGTFDDVLEFGRSRGLSVKELVHHTYTSIDFAKCYRWTHFLEDKAHDRALFTQNSRVEEEQYLRHLLLMGSKFRLIRQYPSDVGKDLVRQRVADLDETIHQVKEDLAQLRITDSAKLHEQIRNQYDHDLGEIQEDYARVILGRSAGWVRHRINFYRQDLKDMEETLAEMGALAPNKIDKAIAQYRKSSRTIHDVYHLQDDDVARIVIQAYRQNIVRKSSIREYQSDGRRWRVKEEALDQIPGGEAKARRFVDALNRFYQNHKDMTDQQTFLEYHILEVVNSARLLGEVTSQRLRVHRGKEYSFGDDCKVKLTQDGPDLDISVNGKRMFKNGKRDVFLEFSRRAYPIVTTEGSAEMKDLYQLCCFRHIELTFEKLLDATLDDEQLLRRSLLERVRDYVADKVRDTRPEDYLEPHAANTREWVLKLMPNASEAVLIASLHHDLDRAFPDKRVTKREFGLEDNITEASWCSYYHQREVQQAISELAVSEKEWSSFYSVRMDSVPSSNPLKKRWLGVRRVLYDAYKAAHPLRSAEILGEALRTQWDADPHVIEDAMYLVRVHETGSADRSNILHVEANILKTADTASFLQDNLPTYVREHQSSLDTVREKVRFMWDRLNPAEQITLNPLYLRAAELMKKQA
ncbi:MAG TPA: hypothetical protein VJH97_05655 [Candidatus Nanoarchaeia archaeon]|nr:hypothetical protein [Candidatus Nanoarchaeia archaeon]